MKSIFFLTPLALALTALLPAQEVRLYTQRHYDADKEILADFTKQTGIEVKVIEHELNKTPSLLFTNV